jgi:hypothetical protein
MAEKLIDLTVPIKGHGGKLFAQVKLREPTARDFIELGLPQSPVYGPNQTFTMADNDQIIAAYLQRCIREPIADIVFGQITLADAIRLREGLLDFFIAARAAAMVVSAASSETSATIAMSSS